MMSQIVPVYAAPAAPANAVGMMVVKEAPAPTAEEIALNAIRQQRQYKKNMGNINIADDIINSLARGKKPDNPELVLAEAIEAANNQHFEKVLSIMEHLHNEHPESRAILKWLSVYQNWAGQYADSNNSLRELVASYPLNPEEVEGDFMVAYYAFDNARHLDTVDSDKLDALGKMAEKQTPYKLGGQTYAEVAKTLAAYQKFMVKTDCGKTLTPTDSKALDELWKMIPKDKQEHLDNFFGYNIDELTPIYASFYHRKDLTEAYVERQKPYPKHIADAAIKDKQAEKADASAS